MPSVVNNEVKYIYQLPYHERKSLCVILDQRDSWEELAGDYMKFDVITILMLRRETLCGRSPTDALLWHWSQQNHTVGELFVLLSRMQHYQAMMVLKPFVDQQYHRLIYEGEENLGCLAAQADAANRAPSPAVSRSPTPSQCTRTLNDQGMSASSGASEARGGVRSTDKNLHIDSRNRNVSAVRADMPSKVVLPAAPEHKILNTQHQQHEQQQHQQQVLQQQQTPEPQPLLPRKGSTGSETSSLVDSCSIPQVKYVELEHATSGWSPNAILGKGGFGTVFKGIWNNTAVAVKRLEQRKTLTDQREQDQLLMRELSFPNSCRHDNVLPIYGVSLDGPTPCLVYQFMPNGSVEDRLLCRGGTPPLSWVHRLKIAEGTALGLQFLHTRPIPVVHGDIKSANILMTSEFEPRIADFGLAREGPHSDYTHKMVSRVHGTRPYLPEEFLRSREFSVKVDTYSFGVVLFELATGLRAYQGDREHKYLKDLVKSWDEPHLSQLLDRRAPDEDCGVFMGLIMLGKQCVAHQRSKRPDMVDVLKAVRNLAAATEPLRIQYRTWVMLQSRASPSLAGYEYLAPQRRGSSPQASLPTFPHQSVMMEQGVGCPQPSMPEGLGPYLRCPSPQLPVHQEEEEELASTVPDPQGRGLIPHFSKLFSGKLDSVGAVAATELSLSNLRLGIECCASVETVSKEKAIDL